MINYDHLAAIGQEFFLDDEPQDPYFIEEYDRHFHRINEGSLPEDFFADEEAIEQARAEYFAQEVSAEVDTPWWDEDLEWHPITDAADVVSYMDDLDA